MTNKNLRVALAQLNTTVGDLAGNRRKITEAIDQATAENCDLIVFPELTICGYPPEDLLLKPHFIRDIQREIQYIAQDTNDITVVVGAVEQDKQGNIYNTAVVLQNRKIQASYRKMLLPNYSVFDEQRYFKSGQKNLTVVVKGIPMALTICEDIWADNSPACQAAYEGQTQFIINLSGSPYHLGKGLERENLLSQRAQETGNIICYANLVGGQDELVFDGESLVVGPNGKILARGKQFTEDFLITDIEITQNSKLKTQNSPNIIAPRLSELEEVYQALALGIRDYVRKNGFQKVVLGLSGGIDSALTAVIAVKALGKENVTCVSMPSCYSSSETQQDARTLAQNLGVPFEEIAIGNIFEAMLQDLAPFFDDLPANSAEENLQARIRGNILMALSNKFGWLVLSTGNKSEVATGYCTLYGDMAGGFNVLKDVPKTLVYKLSEWVNKMEDGRWKMEALLPHSILTRSPSAELRPNQTDQDSLPPYDILDKILELYVENDASFDEIIEQGFEQETVRKIINLVDQNEYKRRQAAPGVKISPKAFGKDRRMPLTNWYRI